MIDFGNIHYLQHGSAVQQKAYKTLVAHNLFNILKDFDPILTGTIPIHIDIEGSDLDIACCWSDKEIFIDHLNQHLSTFDGFAIRELLTGGYQTVLANFTLGEFPVEIFAQNRPSREQESFRHMVIEHELLHTRGEDFRRQIIALKKAGMKTEPAFARLLGLTGDPYTALLNLSPHK